MYKAEFCSDYNLTKKIILYIIIKVPEIFLFFVDLAQVNRRFRVYFKSMLKRRKPASQAVNAGPIIGSVQKAYLCHHPISTRKLNSLK